MFRMASFVQKWLPLFSLFKPLKVFQNIWTFLSNLISKRLKSFQSPVNHFQVAKPSETGKTTSTIPFKTLFNFLKLQIWNLQNFSKVFRRFCSARVFLYIMWFTLALQLSRTFGNCKNAFESSWFSWILVWWMHSHHTRTCFGCDDTDGRTCAPLRFVNELLKHVRRFFSNILFTLSLLFLDEVNISVLSWCKTVLLFVRFEHFTFPVRSKYRWTHKFCETSFCLAVWSFTDF